ncbi:E3 ubiquitin-protein ligase Siah1 [Rhipicephalus sanguineus]|uniref:E3 ubiquitin-protein ligase Siah1 n=1 Tax=Rhipicephalus sanguineus TaxID=34632 RepID=UPI001894CA33|nr:E3 ubiquitin-protein ligase Siah1 [Rhipicephalus sanguineus]
MEPLHGATAFEDSMLSLFECPVCSDSVLPPVVQCSNGHVVCSICRETVDTCPLCREQFGCIRNLTLEKIAEKVKFPCKFKSAGCTLTLLAADKLWHQSVCLFRSIKCPHPGGECEWQGTADEIKQHLVSSHPFVMTCEGQEMMLCGQAYGAEDAIFYWMQLQLCFGREFLLVLRRRPIDDERWRYCAVVQMIDPDDNAANGFAYHLEFHGLDGQHAREGMPLGIEDNVNVALDNSDCLEFDISNDQIELCGGVVRIKSTIEDLS